uniref:Uncharacterized protein n=1 Tax=Anguilla anguilla TaxID=7936 RepID=A0A0E9SW19_ANGAN
MHQPLISMAGVNRILFRKRTTPSGTRHLLFFCYTELERHIKAITKFVP